MPSADGDFRFGIAAEDGACAQAAKRLADRVLLECEPWIDDGTHEAVRTWWSGPDDGYLRLSKSTERARTAGLPIYGHFDGAPGGPDAAMFRACMLLVEHEKPGLTLLIIARDLDGRPEKRRGFERAYRHVAPSAPTLFAGMQPCAEAFYLVGFRAENPDEQRRIAELAASWSVDPTATTRATPLSQARGEERQACAGPTHRRRPGAARALPRSRPRAPGAARGQRPERLPRRSSASPGAIIVAWVATRTAQGR